MPTIKDFHDLMKEVQHTSTRQRTRDGWANECNQLIGMIGNAIREDYGFSEGLFLAASDTKLGPRATHHFDSLATLVAHPIHTPA